ncbi:MAG: hypothetical protein ACRD3E_18230 [Terriglobales bacterium]
MLRRIFIGMLCLTLVSCKSLVEKYKRSSSGTSSVDKRVLYDFRSPFQFAKPPVDDKTVSMLLATNDKGTCTSRQPTPQVESLAEGSFTYAAEKETAYLVVPWRCSPENRLIVFSGSKLQAASDTSFNTILKTYDLNGDDKNEMLLGVETTKDGVTDREASLVDFEKNTLHTVEDFGTVYHDPCALFRNADARTKQELIAGGRQPMVETVVVWYLPRPGNQMPSFTAVRYHAPCPATPGTPPTGWTQLGER